MLAVWIAKRGPPAKCGEPFSAWNEPSPDPASRYRPNLALRDCTACAAGLRPACIVTS